MTNKQARNIANWIFNEAQRNTESGNWITYFDEIKEQYNVEMNKENAELIIRWLCKLYGEAILDANIGYDLVNFEKPDCIDITIGTWYYENDEDDDEE